MTVARFLADLAAVLRPATPADPSSPVVAGGQMSEREGLRPGTLSGYLAAISVVHQTAVPYDGDQPFVSPLLPVEA